MELEQVIHGFTVLERTPVDELEAALWRMEHKKSGARLVWLERAEENKTFSIAFQTQPIDDTGVFHILEHSVLCGSDRYPVKEPFVELMKSSLNTFLNALTGQDATIYPVSSRNGQDFINLMRVYMDAVLHPLIHSKPEIFGQEGWHYELSDAGEPSYKGVVFNEMKGYYASPDALAGQELNRRLYPDNCYRYASGGDPAHIPELTYEQFAATHKRLYHPSNAYIFLDGQIDVQQVLGILDGEYLSAYERIPAPAPIAFQSPVDGGTSEIFYELSAQEDLEGRARLVDGFVACTWKDREEITALQALADALCGDNQAPLTRKLLESGLAKNVNLGVSTGILQPCVVLEARDVREDQLDAVSAALREELERLVREGLDHQRVCAALDNMEFQARERDQGRFPQGLMFNFQVLESWMYGGDPAANLSVGDLYDRLRARCDEGWFEALLERVLLKNNHKCRLIMRPSHTLGQERQEAETARLHAAQSAWSEDEAGAVRQAQARIDAWQNTPDTPEQLATIPVLRLDQIPAEPEKLPLEKTERAGLPVLLHHVPTGGITYLNLYFAMDDLTEEEIRQASFLARLLGRLETERHSLEELQRELRSRFGKINFAVESYGRQGDAGQCRSFLCASCSVLDGKLENGLTLLAELLTETKLDNAKHASDYLVQLRPALAEQLASAGHMTAINRILARSSASGVVQENANNVTFLRWLAALEKDFQNQSSALLADLTALARKLFCRARLTLSVTGANAAAADMTAELLARRLPEGGASGPQVIRPWGAGREGIVIPSDVGYAAMGGLVPSAANGGTQAAARTVALAHLWNAVRVQGGAYGVGLLLREHIQLGTFYSYRDPTPARSMDCYRASGDFLRNAKDMDLTGMIIGAVADADPLLTPRMRGKNADAYYWVGATYEDRRRLRRELLSAGQKDLMVLADELDKLTANASVCVLGSRKQLDECAGLDEVTVL